MFKITEKRFLNQNVVYMSVEAPFVAAKAEAGQFIMIRCDDKGERIPLTIADFDRENGTVSIIFQTVGFTTTRLSTLEAGDFVADFVGPLGKPTELGNPKKAIVIGGGVGCAIAYSEVKALYKMGVDTTVIAGFRNKDMVILEEEMKKVSNNLYITTDDGSYARRGLVTEVLKELLEKEAYDLVIAIGPIPMMKFVSLTTKPYKVKTIVSLNPIMIDGTGMCGGCRVTVGGEIKFACVDGPDFDGHLVDFDNLMKRNSFYKEQEQRAAEHKCRLFGGVHNG